MPIEELKPVAYVDEIGTLQVTDNGSAIIALFDAMDAPPVGRKLLALYAAHPTPTAADTLRKALNEIRDIRDQPGMAMTSADAHAMADIASEALSSAPAAADTGLVERLTAERDEAYDEARAMRKAADAAWARQEESEQREAAAREQIERLRELLMEARNSADVGLDLNCRIDAALEGSKR